MDLNVQKVHRRVIPMEDEYFEKMGYTGKMRYGF